MHRVGEDPKAQPDPARAVWSLDLRRPRLGGISCLRAQRDTTPVTIINGRHDRVVPVANPGFLDERLPTSRLVLLDAGHFVWEEMPSEYASVILDSITGNWP